jgi:hypothetical protein
MIKNKILADIAYKKLNTEATFSNYGIDKAKDNNICIRIKSGSVELAMNKALESIKSYENISTYVSGSSLLYIYDTSDKEKKEEFIKFKTYMKMSELVKAQEVVLGLKVGLLEAMKDMHAAGMDMSDFKKLPTNEEIKNDNGLDI